MVGKGLPGRGRGSAWMAGWLALVCGALAAGTVASGQVESSGTQIARDEQLLALERYHVVRNGWSKKIRFEGDGTAEILTMRYKGIPWSRDSAWNILVDKDRYGKSLNRVRYRFEHPISGRRMILQARSTAHSVRTVPIRSEDTAPAVEIFEGESEEPFASVVYDFQSRELFRGTMGARRFEIERVSEDTPLDHGFLKHFLFPFPVLGDFVVRLEGREVAWFSQGKAQGVSMPYDLALAGGLQTEEKEDAVLAFIIFDRVGEFIEGAQ
ncbi:MAG: hypothetical protein KDD47_06670 [Acidobacteria bacterium]|nr:hypothetical protein [Acidobacteriota bacterium]